MAHLYEKLIDLLKISPYQFEIASIGKNTFKQSIKSKNFPTAEALLKVKAAFPEMTDFIEAEKKTWESRKLSEMKGFEVVGQEQSTAKDVKLEVARQAMANPKPKAHNPKVVSGPLQLVSLDEPLPELIPITEDRYAAGSDGGFADMNPVILGYMQAPELKDCTRTVYAKGNSMEPLFSSGDMLGIEDLPAGSLIMNGYIYAISYERYSVVKRLRKSEKDGIIRLCSDNLLYEEDEIKRSEITHLAIVRVILPFSKVVSLY